MCTLYDKFNIIMTNFNTVDCWIIEKVKEKKVKITACTIIIQCNNRVAWANFLVTYGVAQ